ncbi:MAG: hypothetical protein AAF191_20420 [Verrucomicrobiota bacterium]
MKVEAGDTSGTQRVLVMTDGSAEITKRDAQKALSEFGGKYDVKDWAMQEMDDAGEDTVAAEEEPPAAMPSSLLAEEQEWTNSSGKTITAAVRTVERGKVHFLMEGRLVEYPVSQLSEESVAKLKELMAAQ